MVASAACAPKYTPPETAPAQRPVRTINAPFSRVWDATIDAFAAANIPIETLDRASGLLVPKGTMYVGAAGAALADCGGVTIPSDITPRPVYPSSVKFNVVVRGDSSAASVQVRTFFASEAGTTLCVSKGVFEDMMEKRIADRAASPSPH